VPSILCVDDDRHLCGILAKALSGAGYEVRVAHDGEAALEELATAPPDLLLLDVTLPKRDGFEVLECLRLRGKSANEIPVVLILDGLPTPQYRQRAADLGASTLLTKPVALATLLDTVAKQLCGTGEAQTDPGAKGQADAEPLSGTLAEHPFPALLHHLHGLRATGVLYLGAGQRKKALQFRDGYAVAVKSNVVSECLGNYLVQTGHVPKPAVRESLKRMKQEGGLQGEILVAMKMLSEEELARALEGQAHQKLFEIFEWTQGKFRFQIGGMLERANTLALRWSPADVILDGVRSRFPLEPIDAHLSAKAQSYVAQGASPFYRFQEVHFEEGEEEFLRELDGSRRLSEFLEADEKIRRVLYALLVTEMLELRDSPPERRARQPASELRGAPPQTPAEAPTAPPTAAEAPSEQPPLPVEPTSTPPPAPAEPPSAPPAVEETRSELPPTAVEPTSTPPPAAPRSRTASALGSNESDVRLRVELAAMAERMGGADFFEILGVPRDAPLENIESAYAELARSVHPDRFSGAGDAVKQLAEDVFTQVAQAYETLSDSKRRAAYRQGLEAGARPRPEVEEEQRTLKAEVLFQRGESKLRDRDPLGALECFHSAVRLHPDDGEYHAYQGWAHYLARPEELDEAIALVREGARLAFDRPMPYLFLGRMVKAQGRLEMAEKLFTRVLQIAPDSVEGLRELRLIEAERKKSKGLLARLLGK
jgi:CheY-like chemotaxis protein